MNIILFNDGEYSLPIADERSQHILKVLKLKEGDRFKAGFINGNKGVAEIIDISSSNISFSFNFDSKFRVTLPLTLIIALVRPICMKRILRETVSIGVRRLILTGSDLGEKSYLTSSLYKTDEYKKIMVNGAMQAGETFVPECIFTNSVEEAIEYSSGDRLLLDNLIGNEELFDYSLKSREVTLAIGGERGWTNRERDLFLSSSFTPLLLGNRILRTETAVVASTFLALSKINNLV